MVQLSLCRFAKKKYDEITECVSAKSIIDADKEFTLAHHQDKRSEFEGQIPPWQHPSPREDLSTTLPRPWNCTVGGAARPKQILYEMK
jgi:hypothetical protein